MNKGNSSLLSARFRFENSCLESLVYRITRGYRLVGSALVQEFPQLKKSIVAFEIGDTIGTLTSNIYHTANLKKLVIDNQAARTHPDTGSPIKNS
jgi:hypothetical protein